MAVADMLPTMDDKDLASLHANASRLETAGVTEVQRQSAAQLLPLIKAELKSRGKAVKNGKPIKAPPAPKAKAKAKAAPAVRKSRAKKPEAESAAAAVAA